jgi:hypothetical protein
VGIVADLFGGVGRKAVKEQNALAVDLSKWSRYFNIFDTVIPFTAFSPGLGRRWLAFEA